MANGIVLNIDTTKSEFQNPMVQLRQGDGNYQSLNVTVTSNGEPFDLTGWTITFMGTTAGGFKIVDAASVVTDAVQGEFTYTPTKAWGQDQGEFKNAYFKFVKSDETASGASFRVNVLDAVDLTAAEAQNYISVVDVMIGQVKTDMDTKLAETKQTLTDTQTQANTVQTNVNDLNASVNELKAQNNNIKTTDNDWTGSNTFNKKIISPSGVQGNADTATKLQTPRKINGVEFDGTSDITVDSVIRDFGRQNTLSDKFNSSVDDIGGETPDYYVDRINGSDFTELSPNNFNVGFITDAHFQYGGNYGVSDKHFKYSGSLARVANLDAYVAGGDNINGDHNRKNKYNQAINVTETLINRVPDTTDVFFLLGNHDTGIGQFAQTSSANLKVSDNLDEKTIKSIYRTGKSYYGEVRDGDSLYGYKDYPNKKVRLIFINSFDLPFTSTNSIYDWNFLQNSGLQNSQLNWLANTALKLPDVTWQVIIFSHAPISGSFDTITQENTDALLGILKAYKNGNGFSLNDSARKLPVTINVDYSAQGVGTLIAFISGHVHQDGQMVYQGLNLIQTTCSWSNTVKNSARVVETSTEDAQDIFSINTSARTISIKRFGYGSNRSYTY